MESKAAQTVAMLAGLYLGGDGPDTDQRVASFWWGQPDEPVSWALSLAHTVSPDPIARHLYIAHVAEDTRHNRAIKDWGYRQAVEFVGARGSGQRRRSMVESYRPEWGQQAARDGLALAMWGHLRDCVPGIGKRAEALSCGKQAYQRVRDEVQRQTCDLIAGFRLDVTEILDERFSADFRNRWELATGKRWS